MSRCGATGCRGPDGQARWGDPFVCQPCSIRAARSVRTWPRYFVELSNALVRGSADDVRRSPGFESTPTINIAALAQRELLVVVARAVEAQVCAELGLPIKRRSGRPGPIVDVASRFVAGAWPGLIRVSGVVPIVDRVLWLDWSIRRTVGWTPLVHRLPAPCPACDLRALVRHDGDDKVICRECRATWTEDEYHRLVLILAEEARRA